MIRGFRSFLLRGNVIDLAVGIVVGAAFNSVVQSFVNDFVKPLIALIGGQANYSRYYFAVRGQKFDYGDFLGSLLTFMIDAAVVYFLVVTPLRTLQDRLLPGRPPAPTRDCPFCLSKIPEAASKCMYCTSAMPAA